MNLFVRCFIAAIAIQSAAFGVAQDRTESASRTQHLLNRADLMSIEWTVDKSVGENVETAKISRVVEPILKYQNPLYEQQSDGILVVWTAEEVPVAFGSYSIRNDKTIFRELATSSELPMRCKLDDKTVWAPVPRFTRRPLDSKIPVPDDDRVRLRIMKRQAERFNHGNQRVLTTPLYRYKNDSQGIVDGTVFALSDTNDPELLILIEAARPNNSDVAIWRYTLARMNSQPRQVRLDGELVWELAGYWRNPKSIEDPYVESLDSELPADLRLNPSK